MLALKRVLLLAAIVCGALTVASAESISDDVYTPTDAEDSPYTTLDDMGPMAGMPAPMEDRKLIRNPKPEPVHMAGGAGHGRPDKGMDRKLVRNPKPEPIRNPKPEPVFAQKPKHGPVYAQKPKHGPVYIRNPNSGEHI